MTPILIETNSSHLKNQGWEGYFPFGNTNFQGGYVCFREGSLWMPILSHSFFAPSFTSNMWAECQVIECIEEHNKYTTSTCKKGKNHTHTHIHTKSMQSLPFSPFFSEVFKAPKPILLVYYMKRCFSDWLWTTRFFLKIFQRSCAASGAQSNWIGPYRWMEMMDHWDHYRWSWVSGGWLKKEAHGGLGKYPPGD